MLHLARDEGRERYFGCNLMQRKVVAAAGPVLAGVPRVVVTDVDGSCAFEALPPGAYTITFTLPGFEELARTVELAAASAPTVDVSLRVGGLFEEVTVTVTGTAIDAPAINMPHAVVVVSRDTIEQQGSTQLVDLFKNLSVSHGVIGERSSWYNSNQPSTLTENVANVNLRGLGASRTLVLINSRRHVPVPARLTNSKQRKHLKCPEDAEGYCQVEAFRADPTPRYWQRRALKPHHLAARFELETSNLTIPSAHSSAAHSSSRSSRSLIDLDFQPAVSMTSATSPAIRSPVLR